MNLDLLMNEWAERDRRLESSIRLNSWLLRETWLERHRGALTRLGPRDIVERLTAIPVIVCLGIFAANHFGDLRFFIPAALLDAWCVVMLVLGIRQREALRTLDFSQPLLTLQKQVETLKIARLRLFNFALLSGQVLWFVPFLIVFFKGVFGVNLYAASEFMPRFMFYNVAAGLAFIPVAMGVARLVSGRVTGLPWFQRLTDGIAGRDIVAARSFLDQLAKFEKEEAAL